MRRRWLQILMWGSSAFLGFLLAAPLMVRRSNCGGNSAAQVQVRNLALLVRMQLEEGSGLFRIDALSPNDSAQFRRFQRNHWIPRANFLVRREVSAGADSNLVIAVCDQVFSNVPQPTVWNLHRKTPAHAVAFRDGRSGLIPPDQFARMDLAPFVNLSTLSPPSP